MANGYTFPTVSERFWAKNEAIPLTYSTRNSGRTVAENAKLVTVNVLDCGDILIGISISVWRKRSAERGRYGCCFT